MKQVEAGLTYLRLSRGSERHRNSRNSVSAITKVEIISETFKNTEE